VIAFLLLILLTPPTLLLVVWAIGLICNGIAYLLPFIFSTAKVMIGASLVLFAMNKIMHWFA